MKQLVALYKNFNLSPLPEIHNFAVKGDFGSIQRLVSRGIDINLKDSQNRTVLIHAVKTNRVNFLKMIIHLKPNLNIVDKQNYTAIDYACENNRFEIITELLNYYNQQICSYYKDLNTKNYQDLHKFFIELKQFIYQSDILIERAFSKITDRRLNSNFFYILALKEDLHLKFNNFVELTNYKNLENQANFSDQEFEQALAEYEIIELRPSTNIQNPTINFIANYYGKTALNDYNTTLNCSGENYV